jgi:drug/metabolite transporter (DMT)-like permease
LHWQPGKADLQVFLAALLAGSGWLFSVNALKELPALFFIGSRFLLAGLIIAVFVRRPLARPGRKELAFLALAAVALALSMIGWITGLKHTSHIGVAAFITATGNLMVPFVGTALFGWPMSRSLLASFAIALCGLAFLFLDTSSTFDPSHLVFLGSAGMWAISITLVKNSQAKIGIAALTSMQLGLSGLIILLVSALTGGLPTAWPSTATSTWFLLSVLLSTCARFTLQFRGQRALAPGRAAILMAFEPIWAMMLGVVLLGTSVSLAQAIGCSIIFIAIALEISRISSAEKPLALDHNLSAKPKP